MKRKKKIILGAVASPFIVLLMTIIIVSIVNPTLLEEGVIYLEQVITGRSPRHGIDARNANIDGIDVSHHNGKIDWDKVAENKKIKFAYTKATQGSGYVDPLFRRNVTNAQKAGINVGVYHFFTRKTSGRMQYEFFRKTVRGCDGNLIPMVDVENKGIGRMSAEDLQRELGDFCDLVQKEYGRKPIIYTNADIYHRLMGKKFDSYYIWLGSYGLKPKLRGNTKHNIWQFTEHGKVEGIRSLTDLNTFENGMSIDKLLR